MTRAEEHAEKVRRGFVAPDWDLDAKAALSELVADAEALAEALNWIVDNSTEDQVRHVALIALSARYRGEMPSSIRTHARGCPASPPPDWWGADRRSRPV